MKTLSVLILSATLTLAGTSSVSAYHLHPKNISARLRGTLTFYPYEKQPFNCNVTMYLKTKGFIKSVKLGPGNNCSGVSLTGLPWAVGIVDGDAGQFGRVGFLIEGGGCSEGIEVFNDNKAGIWSLPSSGQCFSGTLNSIPPVTIRQ